VSLDQRVQEAADSVLVGATKRTALVAIQPSTGKVLAVSNSGPGPNDFEYPLALSGQYAPGSSFKVVTTYALLGKGLTVDTPVNCPPTATVGGRVFHNAENEVLGVVPFHQDFAQSCNTAFVGLSPQVGGTALPDAAHALGLGIPRNLGTPVPTASVPVPGDAADLAAEAFGQGRLAVTPLDMAGVAASVAAGTSRPLRLVLDATPPPGPASALSPAIVTSLQQLMREVVTSGTGTALAGVPGAPVAGKTGTAEYGTTEPPRTHAWFIGYQGDLAFSVFVEDGGFGGDAAAPIAAKFLTALAGGG
jgi:cell division protein FtsI/penicillin-binding protein 2